MDIAKAAAARLKSLRIASGMSQQAVADAIGVDRSSYCYYEKGDRLPASERLVVLSDLFGASVDYILGLSDDPTLRRVETETVQAAIDGAPEVTGEQIAAALPEEYREAVIALIRAELHKQG